MYYTLGGNCIQRAYEVLFFSEMGEIGLWGQIPVAFGNLPYLRLFELSKNSLSGTIPPEIGVLSRLEVLDIANNNLNGIIPSHLGALTAAIIRLNRNDHFVGDDE